MCSGGDSQHAETGSNKEQNKRTECPNSLENTDNQENDDVRDNHSNLVENEEMSDEEMLKKKKYSPADVRKFLQKTKGARLLKVVDHFISGQAGSPVLF